MFKKKRKTPITLVIILLSIISGIVAKFAFKKNPKKEVAKKCNESQKKQSWKMAFLFTAAAGLIDAFSKMAVHQMHKWAGEKI